MVVDNARYQRVEAAMKGKGPIVTLLVGLLLAIIMAILDIRAAEPNGSGYSAALHTVRLVAVASLRAGGVGL
jgi:hypothetical protein